MNTSSQAYVISKNYKVSKISDYHENECFLTALENKHLAIALNKLFNQRVKSQSKSQKTILSNKIIVHKNEKIVERITNVINKYLNVWKNISKTVNVSQKRWMRIKIILETNFKAYWMYKLEIENQAVIDKEFDALHA
jgi:hypothetical protein